MTTRKELAQGCHGKIKAINFLKGRKYKCHNRSQFSEAEHPPEGKKKKERNTKKKMARIKWYTCISGLPKVRPGSGLKGPACQVG